MKRKTKTMSAVILCLVLLCSCSRQRYISQNEFARRFNSCEQTFKLAEDSYYEKDGEFCFFSGDENLRKILISLKQNEKFYVTEAELTAVRDGSDLTEQEKEELLKTAVSMLSVICNCTQKEIQSALTELNFDKNKFTFGSVTENFSIMKAECFFYSNSEMISLNIQIK